MSLIAALPTGLPQEVLDLLPGKQTKFLTALPLPLISHLAASLVEKLRWNLGCSSGCDHDSEVIDHKNAPLH